MISRISPPSSRPRRPAAEVGSPPRNPDTHFSSINDRHDAVIVSSRSTSGDSDPNPNTVGDPTWTPFIQSSHFPAGSQTPAYPDYVSGANGLTGSVVSMLQLFFRTDWLPFEINKATAASVAICTNPRTYRRLSDAAQEVVDARILLGIHFRSADVEARRLGARVASWTFANKLRPVRHHDDDDHDDGHDHDD